MHVVVVGECSMHVAAGGGCSVGWLGDVLRILLGLVVLLPLRLLPVRRVGFLPSRAHWRNHLR